MRVFVTGGTGFIGAALVRDLLAAGHDVLGLARSDASAARLAAAGATPHRGSLEDLDALRDAAARTDGVIHTAFDNSDLARFADNSRTEQAALEAIGGVLAGSGRPLAVTAGFAFLAPGTLATENDVRPPGASPLGRTAEATAAALAASGVRTCVVRLPCVHGDGDRFTIPQFTAIAERTGVSAYVGDGLNRWAAVHNVDAARVYRLAFERAAEQGEPGARYHAVAEEGVPVKAIAEVIGRRLGIPVRSLPPEAAAQHFGAHVHFVQSDAPASSALTRERLGWHPQGPGLLADIARPNYGAT
ncbi:SDR family oxidoreductase [Streptomyces sp. CA2R106]|uniref:SDR family oxidoreductase n=1 Tax=Streptomyces sp. CA2R106 TaxID=3120153 RepID=UPI00300B909A